jgi:hypothetical protein
MTSNYILHTSLTTFLPSILKDKQIKAKKPSDAGRKGVYGMFLSKNINYKGPDWYYGSWIPPFTRKIIFCIDPAILHKLQFVVCPRIQYGLCEPVMTQDNLSLAKLEKFINGQMALAVKNKSADNGFIHTHEVCIGGSIPLEYIKQVIVSQKEINMVREIIKTAGYADSIRVIKKPLDWHDIF